MGQGWSLITPTVADKMKTYPWEVMGKFVYSVGTKISVATTIDSLHAYVVYF